MLEPTRHSRRNPSTFLAITMVLVLSSTARAETSLFPEPLHLTRIVASAIDGSSQTIEEFYSGSQVVSVSGSKVTVADYTKRELITIDRAARTFSVTTFETIASQSNRCGVSPCPESVTVAHAPPASRPSHRLLPGNRERYELMEGGPDERLVVTVDRGTLISRDAFDVIVGAAYPNSRSHETDRMAMLAARDGSSTKLRSQSVDSTGYGLPVEQTTTMQTPSGEVTVGSVVTRVGHETVPQELITIPADFGRVESPGANRKRQLEELDSLPMRGSPRP
ncbi:MAG TPA: hypothetical protein VNM92_12085 [Thermoanaerobaculia bacterium]|nr:hypothetical protein [Thermoanaerobaculia bacterium]